MANFKVKMLTRNPDVYLRETKKDIHKIPRNYDPNLHPFEAPREYTLAMNAVKLERVFAKPFLAALDGHGDGVHCLCKHPKRLSTILSGACDGEIRVWNLPRRKCIQNINAHDGFVRGICFNPDGQSFFSCGDDQTIKHWNMNFTKPTENQEPINTIISKHVFYGIDHHWSDTKFATCGEVVEIWDEEKSEPIRSFQWGVDSVQSVKFSPVERHVLGATASDRSIILYDMRGSQPLRKVILKLRSNKIAWNPIEAYTFTVANEDYNLYSFDMRRLDMPVMIHKDHVAAVMDLDYSPTGQEFVAGSYDKTIRLFQCGQSRSREIYHTKRMQRVQVVAWSLDDKFIISGSDEMNLRLWKANASEKLGVLQPREKASRNYNAKLMEKFAHHPKVSRIRRHRHVPKEVYHTAFEHRTIREAQKKREMNKKLHSKPGAVPFVKEKKKPVVQEVE